VLDGIGGVPLGREISESIRGEGHAAIHFDCLKQPVRPLYGIRSAYAKTINRRHDRDSFYFLPRFSTKSLSVLIEAEQPNIILAIGFIYKFFDPQELRRLADKHGARLFLYDTDSCNLYDKRREFIFFLENELPIYDGIYSFSRVTTSFFKNTLGLPAVWLPFAAQPVPAFGTEEKTIDALFVGNADLRRIFLLEHIKDKVTVFGSRWQRNYPLISSELQARISNREVWGDELHGLLARAKIVLNITRTDFYGAETGINLRIFEALAAGCFLLTDHCVEIETLFQSGKEIETFRSSQELLEKVHYYLEHESERLAIARRGHEKFLANHTWASRIREVLAEMKVKPLPC
jgi:spore maturation protein CgeB